MRILFVSNAPWVSSGYGKPIRCILPYLHELGHATAVLGYFGLLGSSVKHGGVTVYPAYNHAFGADVAPEFARHFEADAVMTMIDAWVFPSDFRLQLEMPWIAWFPIDGVPAPPIVVDRTSQADYRAAFSEFGQRQMQTADVDCGYVPLGVDCEIFKPGSKKDARETLGFPQEAFIATMVAANNGFPSRKSFPEALQAFARFRVNHKEAVLYLHTFLKPLKDGINFLPLIKDLRLPDSAVILPNEAEMRVGVPDEQMALVYQASDVLLSPSMGEGFGLPIVEAQACGTPVVTQDVTSMSELTVNGKKVEPLQRFWLSGLDYWQFVADVEKVHAALECVYDWSDEERCAGSVVGVRFIKDSFDWSVVVQQHLGPLLDKVEAELW